VNSLFVFTDQQGCVLSVFDENGRKVFDATYDAWGRQTVRLNAFGLRRGYTGHEMMGEFRLINMNRRSLARSGESNGRLYDPTPSVLIRPTPLSSTYHRRMLQGGHIRTVLSTAHGHSRADAHQVTTVR